MSNHAMGKLVGALLVSPVALAKVGALLWIASAIQPDESAFAQATDPFDATGCAETSNPYSNGSTELQSFVQDTSSSRGLRWDAGSGGLVVNYVAGIFSGVPWGVPERVNCPVAGDFDNDGWTDFVGGMNGRNEIRFYKNQTGDMTACPGANCDSDGVDRVWDNAAGAYSPPLGPATVRRPNFVYHGTPIQNLAKLKNGISAGFCGATSGDFDRDGNFDFAYYRRTGSGDKPILEASLWFGNGDGTFTESAGAGLEISARDGTTYNTLLSSPYTTSDLKHLQAQVDNSFAMDWNGDGWTDIIWATRGSEASHGDPHHPHKGQVWALLNNCPDTYDPSNPMPCSVKPQFEIPPSALIVPDSPLAVTGSNRGITALGLADFTNDGVPDLAIAGTGTSEVAIIPGGPGSPPLDLNNPIMVTTAGYHTFMLTGDFTLDGTPDMILGTEQFTGSNVSECWMTPDGNGDKIPDSLPPTGVACDTNNGQHGGYTYYFDNNGTADPFRDGWAIPPGPFTTYGMSCGSGCTLTDWDIANEVDYDRDPQGTMDMLLADGNQSATYFIFANRTTVRYAQCGYVGSGRLDLGALETSEMVVTGVRMTPSPAPHVPSDSSVTYEASNDDGATWYTANDCDGDIPGNGPDWCVEFPDKTNRSVRWRVNLCSNTARDQTPTFYGMDVTFDYAEAREHYRAGVVVNNGVLYLGGFKQPNNQGRFYGLNAGLTTKYFELGEEIDSMSDSSRDIFTVANDGTTVLDFEASNKNDANLQAAVGGTATDVEDVVIWARSSRFGIDAPPVSTTTRLGSVESSTPAIMTPPVKPTWFEHASPAHKSAITSFITAHEQRPTLAFFGSMDGAIHAAKVDVGAGTASAAESWAFVPNSVVGQMVSDRTLDWPTAYPDASPTLADVIFADGTVHTVLVTGMGNGGRSVVALDVTDTVSSAGNVTQPPTPLWEVFPGGSSQAGYSRSKPAVARLEVGGVVQFAAIFGSGLDAGNPAKGKTVVAINVETGAQLWKFESACAITTDIAVFETDNPGEPTVTAIDGVADYAIWADECGNVYKVNPNVSSTWNESQGGRLGLGPVDTGSNSSGGHDIFALFSTSTTTGAIGGVRPISGTIGATSDSSGRMVLYFGTGGIESFNPALGNEFYAVYTDDGTIRDKLVGSCAAGKCEKFYGGVVLTNDQVILSRSTDPSIGTYACDVGSSSIEGYNVDDLSDVDFNVPIASGAAVSGLFGDAGAVYASTLGGNVIKIGASTAENAGDGGSIGTGATTQNGGGQGSGLSYTSQFSWIQVQ